MWFARSLFIRPFFVPSHRIGKYTVCGRNSQENGYAWLQQYHGWYARGLGKPSCSKSKLGQASECFHVVERFKEITRDREREVVFRVCGHNFGCTITRNFARSVLWQISRKINTRLRARPLSRHATPSTVLYLYRVCCTPISTETIRTTPHTASGDSTIINLALRLCTDDV